MTINAKPSIKDGSLMVRGKAVLTGVPQNVVVCPAVSGSAFIGATAATPSSRHVFSLGVLERYRFLCLFREKIWWMIPRVGKSANEIPMETQLLLLEARQDSALDADVVSSDTASANTLYILLLPVLDGQFRATLQGTPSNDLQFCIESGDASVQTSQAFEAVFINSGENPFELIKDSIKILERHKGTFSHIENKKIPQHLDWFGWCTWDAFYTDVHPQGIKEGLQSLSEGGCSPKFLIIDDGWQETTNEFCKEGEPLVEGTQFATRLIDIKENGKFKSSGYDNTCIDLHEFIDDIKEKYGLKYVYLWHALAGYWGGVLPSSEIMKKYNPKLAYPVQSPGNIGNLRDIAMDSLEKYGVGIIDPQKVFDFYNDLHSYLASSGVDGVKVDVQNLIETLGSGYGGRVSLTRKYQQSLEQSIARNFKDNNLISCMSHNSDSIYSSKKSAVARASEDFMPREPTFQTLHIASVAFNSLLLGEIVVPDWDMFHSKHDTAEFHAAARALGGCAVYVSDKPGIHDFKILKKLVLPDGSVLRARHAGRPTRDCLFEDPVMDGKSLLKIWNLNKLSGVVGVFNCQGAGSWPMKEYMPAKPSTPSFISGHASPQKNSSSHCVRKMGSQIFLLLVMATVLLVISSTVAARDLTETSNTKRNAEAKKESNGVKDPNLGENGGYPYPYPPETGGSPYPYTPRTGGFPYPYPPRTGGFPYPYPPQTGGSPYPYTPRTGGFPYPYPPQTGGSPYPYTPRTGGFPYPYPPRTGGPPYPYPPRTGGSPYPYTPGTGDYPYPPGTEKGSPYPNGNVHGRP